MTEISNVNDFNNWLGGNTATLTEDITLNNVNVKQLPTGSVFDGNGHKVTLINNNNGIFELSGTNNTVTIKNTLFDANNVTTVSGGKGLIISSGHDSDGNVILISDCGVTGTFSLGNESGTFIGQSLNDVINKITISNCYSTATISGNSSGGIIGNHAGRTNCDFTINNCYSTGEISGDNAGGITGNAFGNSSTTAVPSFVKNCYSTGNITGDEAGGIVGSYASSVNADSIYIGNCYSYGLISGNVSGGIMGSNTGQTVVVENCLSVHATDITAVGLFMGTASTPIIINCQVGSGSWPANVTSLLDTYRNDTNIWIRTGTFSSGFGLTVFTEGLWDGNVYVSNSSLSELSLCVETIETTQTRISWNSLLLKSKFGYSPGNYKYHSCP